MRSAPGPSGQRRPRSTDPGRLGSPLFLLNLKTFPKAIGPRAVELAAVLARAGKEAGVSVAIAPAMPDLARVAATAEIAVLAQHVDPVDAGPSTGYVPVEAVAAVGARGSLVNHSEHPLPLAATKRVAGELADAGLSAVVCARSPAVAGRLAAFRVPFVAIEPPELIGGSRAVSTAKPRVVVDGVRAVHAVAPSTRVLCGAGIRSGHDVRRAIELGAEGVLVASAVALAARPEVVVADLLSGF